MACREKDKIEALRRTEITIPARDGLALAGTLFEPPPAAWNGAVVLVSAACGCRRVYYQAYASYLARNGFTAITYDYRGIGGSRPRSLRGFRADMCQWGELDMAGAIDWMVRCYPEAAYLAVGHSSGGQVIGFAPNNTVFRSMVSVTSPNAWWGHWPWYLRPAMAALWWVVLPVMVPLVGYCPSRRFSTMEDLPRGVALEWAAWCRRRDYMCGLHGERVREGFRRFRAPLLAYSTSDDLYAPKSSIEALLRFFENAPITHRHVHPREVGARQLSHFGFFRPEFERTLWAETLEWMMNFLSEGDIVNNK
jgi:predicted alpha/beta hydrolase